MLPLGLLLLAEDLPVLRSWRFRIPIQSVGVASRANTTRACELAALCHNAIRRSHRLMPCLVAGICPERYLGLNLTIAIDDGRRQHGRGAGSQIRGREHSDMHC
jgi:hypothetical protein